MTADEKWAMDALHNVLDRSPSDWTTRLVFADLLEEVGLVSEAVCQRWMAEQKRRPLPWGDNPKDWHWYDVNIYGGSEPCDVESELPTDLFTRLGFGRSGAGARGWHIYTSRQIAEADLCQALQLVGS